MSTAEQVREFKRKAWTEPDFVRGYVKRTGDRKGVSRVKNALERRFVARHARGRILDAGCGAGRMLGPLAVAGYDVVGSDISLAMLAQAAERAAAAPRAPLLVQADIERLPFPNGSFDTVISITVLEHFPQFPAILAEYARVLRPGGRVLFEMPNAEQAPETATPQAALAEPEHYVSRLSASGFPEVLQPLGLRLAEVLPYDFWNGNEALARRWRLGPAGRKRVLKWANRMLSVPGAARLWLRCEPGFMARLGTRWAPNLLACAIKAS